MRLKVWLTLAALLTLFASNSVAQIVGGGLNSPFVISTAGTDCAPATNCAVIGDLANVPSLGVYVNVGTSGTFNFEATIDNETWFAVSDEVNDQTLTTVDGPFYFVNIGWRQFRVRASAISGNATVDIVRGYWAAKGVDAVTISGTPSVNIATVNNSTPLAAQTAATLQNAATANGNGSTLDVNGYEGVVFTVNCSVACSGGTTITLQGSENNTNFAQLTQAVQLGGFAAGGVIVNQGTTPTLWFAPVSGLQTIRAVVSSYSAGTITVTARAVSGSVPSAPLGTSTHYTTSAATTNATSVKAAPGQVVGFRLVNTTSAIYYLRMYNLAAAPTCSSATGFVESIPIPHNTGNGAGVAWTNPAPQDYSTGIGFCITAGGSSTDNTAAAAGVYVTILYR